MKVIYVFLFTALLGGLSACKSDNASTTKAAPAAAPAPAAAAAPAATAEVRSFGACGINDAAAFKVFFAKLQADVASNNKEQVADAVTFPIHNVKDRKTFLANYDKIVTDYVRKSLKEQVFEEISSSGKGCSIGSGAIWLQGTDEKNCTIFGINPKGSGM